MNTINLRKQIFVFGSNLRGIHGIGSAKHAKEAYHAQTGVGEGRTGDSYAIPTRDCYRPKGSDKLVFITLELEQIKKSVDKFIQYAIENPNLDFRIVEIGCGKAGYKPSDIIPFFKNIPTNCYLPETWKEIITSENRL